MPGEALLERLPHLVIFALQAICFEREARGVQHQLSFEHEGQGVAEIMRLELGVRGALEGLGIRPVPLHAAMQAGRAGNKALRLGIVLAKNQAHEFVHRIAVEPGRPKGVFRHHPARGEDDEIDVGWCLALRSAP